MLKPDELKEFEAQAEGLDFGKLRTLTPQPKPSLGYHEPDELINFIAQSEQVKEINLQKLSLNGRVVKDEMGEYLAYKAVSNSACKEALKTPLHYFYYINQTLPKKQSKAFDVGTFAHMAFLEPEMFDRVIVEPKAKLNEHAGCDHLLNFYAFHIQRAKSEGIIGIDEYMMINPYDFVDGIKKVEDKRARIEELKLFCPYQSIDPDHKIIVEVLKSNYYRYGGGVIPELLRGAVKEVSIYGNDPATGLSVKIRPDALNVKENIGVDAIISFKTTSADNLSKFIYDSAKYSYELGEGMYQEVASHVTGREFKTTIMIMLQTVPPYLPAVFWWDADDLENGKYKYHNALSIIQECTEKNHFPGFDAMAESGMKGIIKMKQPDWTKKELHPVDIDE